MRVAATWTAATALGFAVAGFLPRGEWVTFFAFGLVACLPQAIALRVLGRSGVLWLVITSIAVPASYLVAVLVAIVTFVALQWMPAGHRHARGWRSGPAHPRSAHQPPPRCSSLPRRSATSASRLLRSRSLDWYSEAHTASLPASHSSGFSARPTN